MRKTKEERRDIFIEKANIIHKNFYDYSKIKYVTNKIPIEIICPIHGSFFQTPSDHLKGYGCSKCSRKYKPTGAEWVLLASSVYNNRYDYSKVEYKDNKTKVTVICPTHGEFQTIPNNHIKGISGCPLCNNELKRKRLSKSQQRFLKDISDEIRELYDFSKSKYINKNTKVCVICRKHGEFWITPSALYHGGRCPKCGYKNQTLLFEKLIKDFPNETILYEYSPSWLGKQRFDIYFPKYNIAVEYDGLQHFIPVKKFGGELKFQETKKLDAKKEQCCIKNNCVLFRIKYDYKMKEYHDLIKNIRDIVESKKNKFV